MPALSICILGGTGFVGSQLAARLVEKGHSIRVLTRHRERHRDLLVLPTATVVQGDVHDLRFLEREFRGCDAVINLIGILNQPRRGRGFRDVHVELVRKTLSACETAGVRRLLHMSALNADAAQGPSQYLRTKGEAEALVRQQRARLISTIFQPSVIFGPGDSFTLRFARLLKLMPLFFPLACAEARFAPVFVDDVVEAFVRALEDKSTYHQTYQLCGPDVYTLRQIVELVARLTDRRRRVVGLSDSLSRLQAHIMDFVPGKPFSTDNYQSLKRDSVCTSNGFADLGVTPQSLSTVAPRYLQTKGRESRLRRWRETAGR